MSSLKELGLTVEEVFEKHDHEFLKFSRVENKFSQRPDMHAFILLDRFFPGTQDMIQCAEHDEYFLAHFDFAELTEAQIIDLIRAGCMWQDGGIRLFA